MIYLDHAATTPVPKAVADAMYTVLTEQYANPNAQYPFGQEMRRSVEDWRAVIAKAVGCEANQLFFIPQERPQSDSLFIRLAIPQISTFHSTLTGNSTAISADEVPSESTYSPGSTRQPCVRSSQ